MNQRTRRIALACIGGLFVARGLWYWDLLPMWDGRLYADCLIDALRRRSVGELNCFDHPTVGFMGLLAIPALFAPTQYGVVLVTNLLLGALAIGAFHRALERLFPGEDRSVERLLLTLALSCAPTLLGNAINLNPDYGVWAFFLLLLPAVLERRRFLVAVVGSLLVLSKETGVLLYATTIGVYVLVFIARRPGDVPGKLRELVTLWPWALPVGSTALFLVWKLWAGSGRLWKGTRVSGLAGTLLSFRFDDPVFESYAIGILALGFTWVFTVFIVIWYSKRGLDFLFRQPRGEYPVSAGTEAFVGLLFAASFYLLTRYRTYFNVRYFLPLVPLVLFAAYVGMSCGLRSGALRKGVLGLMCGLFLLSNYATVDPLTRKLLGTFRFGEHELLHMTARTGECCGYARDQIVYNLEFAQLHYLQDQIYADLKLRPETPLVMDRHADWYFVGRIDPQTHQRTLDREGSFTPKVLSIRDLSSESGPERLHFITLPNYDSELDLKLLSFHYDLQSARTYERHGYSVEVLTLVRRSAGEPQRPDARDGAVASPGSGG